MGAGNWLVWTSVHQDRKWKVNETQKMIEVAFNDVKQYAMLWHF
jgi:hypothetical protein